MVWSLQNVGSYMVNIDEKSFKLIPVFNSFFTREELGQKYLNSKVKISKIDCTKYGIICSSNNIRGYPTLILFHNGKLVIR